jgi:regulator of protease activity HflC (stomatin/prohibitin superfamily)
MLEVDMLRDSRSSRDKVRLHRERLRAQGLRPVQIWVPDVRARSFVAAARKQAKAVAASNYAKADQRFIESVSEHLPE